MPAKKPYPKKKSQTSSKGGRMESRTERTLKKTHKEKGTMTLYRKKAGRGS